MNGDDEIVLNKMEELLTELNNAKPGDKSHKDRRYAIMITDMEKIYAYFRTYILEGN